MSDTHDGSWANRGCMDCFRFENSRLEAELREQKALTEEVHVKLDEAQERNRIDKHKVDMLNVQLDTALSDLGAAREHIAGLYRANSGIRAENAKRRMENRGLQATLDDATEELQQRNEEIAELKRARLYSIPTRYIVGSDSREAACARAKQLEEENARLEADNARLEELIGKLDKAVAKRDERISYAEDALATARKERDEVCDYRVHDLEALNEQTSISLEHVRQDLFNAQAKLTAVRNAVK